MSGANPRVVAFEDELATARKVAEARRELPELTADEILKGLTRELRSASVPGFGLVFYYYPMSAAEHFEVESRISGGALSGEAVAGVLISLVRNRDGALKFNASQAKAVADLPAASLLALAKAVLHTHRISAATAEKK